MKYFFFLQEYLGDIFGAQPQASGVEVRGNRPCSRPGNLADYKIHWRKSLLLRVPPVSARGTQVVGPDSAEEQRYPHPPTLHQGTLSCVFRGDGLCAA